MTPVGGCRGTSFPQSPELPVSVSDLLSGFQASIGPRPCALAGLVCSLLVLSTVQPGLSSSRVRPHPGVASFKDSLTVGLGQNQSPSQKPCPHPLMKPLAVGEAVGPYSSRVDGALPLRGQAVN